jgi:hypothetical protein
VNAFLTLAATRHTIPPEELQEHSRADDIIRAARAGHVPVQLVCGNSCPLSSIGRAIDGLQIYLRRILFGYCPMMQR